MYVVLDYLKYSSKYMNTGKESPLNNLLYSITQFYFNTLFVINDRMQQRYFCHVCDIRVNLCDSVPKCN